MVTTTKIPPFYELIPDGDKYKLKFNMHEGQLRAWWSTKRFVVVASGSQGGKTVITPHWLIEEMKRKGIGDYIMATATFPLLELKLLPECLAVFGRLYNMGTYRDSKKIFECKDGSRIIFASATNPESIESATAKAAVLDEAGQLQFKRETHEAIIRRLSINQGRALYTTTLYGAGWFKNEVYDRALRGDPDYEFIQFDSTMNPAFPKEEFERMRAIMPAWKFDMFYRGRFAKPAGLIYDAFQDYQVVPRFLIPEKWLIFSGHDFGGSNPAALFFAQDPATGYFYAFQEYLPGPGRSTSQHVNEFKKIVSGYNVIKRAGGSHQEQEIRDAYTAHGWPLLEPKILSVEAAIDRVYGLMKLNKLFIFNDLHNTLDEIGSYSRKLDDNYQPTDEIEDKSRYHLMDCMRGILSDFTPETVTSRKLQTVRYMEF